MPFEVKVNVRDGLDIEVTTAVRRGLLAGGDRVLAMSDAKAPREPEPRHGVHMTETGFVRLEPGLDDDTVAVGYGAYWAVWQETNLEYHHPHGGEAGFLSTSLMTGADIALGEVAAALREVFE